MYGITLFALSGVQQLERARVAWCSVYSSGVDKKKCATTLRGRIHISVCNDERLPQVFVLGATISHEQQKTSWHSFGTQIVSPKDPICRGQCFVTMAKFEFYNSFMSAILNTGA
jgi:hypothetical protein